MKTRCLSCSCFILLLGACTLVADRGHASQPAPGAATSTTIELAQLAELPPAGGGLLVFGDSDHDGRIEVVLMWRDANFNFSYRIHERQDDESYPEVHRGVFLYPLAMGDPDGDGKTDLIGQTGDLLQIYESPTPSDHPSLLVWVQQDPVNIIGSARIADTDRDGRMEILHDRALDFGFTGELQILENTADNEYVEVYSLITHGGGRLIGDWDGDGLTEIAYCGMVPQLGVQLTVLESPADDTWVVTFTDTVELDSGAYAQGGLDTDGNGKPEMFFSGDYQGAHTTVIYESSGDNMYTCIATLRAADGSSGSTSNALGNLDGVGHEEYLMDGNSRLYVYRPMAPGQWALIGEIQDTGGHFHPYCFDANENGRAELFWPTDSNWWTTLVLEHPLVPPSEAPDAAWYGTLPVSVSPTPCRTGGSVLLPDAAARGVSRISVFDVAGRLVERLSVTRDPQGRFVWPTRHLAGGVYFLQLEDRRGSPVARGRGVVVR